MSWVTDNMQNSGIYGIVTCHGDTAIKVAKPGCTSNNITEYNVTKNIQCEYVIKHTLGENNELIMKNYPRVVQLAKLNPLEFTKMIKQLMIGLSHIHETGYVHMDLKPTNLLLDDRNNLVIADFGVSHLIGSDIPKVIGSRFFRSPEVHINSNVTASSAQDAWAVGILIHCYYKKPFICNANTNINAEWIKLCDSHIEEITSTSTTDDKIYTLLMSLGDKFDEYVSAISTGIPEELATIMKSCLKLNPTQRMKFDRKLNIDDKIHLECDL
jgi:serine/threonine protein kinase